MPMIVPRRVRTPFDLFLSDSFDTMLGSSSVQTSNPGLMRADIEDRENEIEITIDLPGFDRENVNAEIRDGVLTVTAHTESTSEEETSTFVRKERFTGRCTRSFFVGEDIEEDDVKAKFDNGVLKIDIPKQVEQPKLEEPKSIAIEA